VSVPASPPELLPDDDDPLPDELPDDDALPEDDEPPDVLEDDEGEPPDEAELPDEGEPPDEVELPDDAVLPEDDAPPEEGGDPAPLSPHPLAQERSKPRTVAGSRCRIAYPRAGCRCSLRARRASMQNNGSGGRHAAALVVQRCTSKVRLAQESTRRTIIEHRGSTLHSKSIVSF
jgi:hypothetical protein